VVVFHAPTHQTRLARAMLRKRYGTDASFAMLSMEQPNYATIMKDHEYLRSTFNFMVTYSLATVYPHTDLPNLPITYYPSHILPARAVLQPPKLSYEDKNGYGTGVMVALFTSNCKAAGAAERLKYLQALMEHIDVHSYGGCLNNRKEPSLPDDPAWPAIAQRRARKIEVLSHYRFYLAFENAPIEDYVSEKVYEGLFAGAIPVYRGASSIAQFMPANDSFIDANTLSPKALATMLLSIGQDKQRYESYFAYKQRPLAPHFQTVVDRSYVHPNVLRRMCDFAQQASSMRKAPATLLALRGGSGGTSVVGDGGVAAGNNGAPAATTVVRASPTEEKDADEEEPELVVVQEQQQQQKRPPQLLNGEKALSRKRNAAQKAGGGSKKKILSKKMKPRPSSRRNNGKGNGDGDSGAANEENN
jgi:hypothetical protein